MTPTDKVNELLEEAAVKDKLDTLSMQHLSANDLLKLLLNGMSREDGMFFYSTYHDLRKAMKLLGYEL